MKYYDVRLTTKEINFLINFLELSKHDYDDDMIEKEKLHLSVLSYINEVKRLEK